MSKWYKNPKWVSTKDFAKGVITNDTIEYTERINRGDYENRQGYWSYAKSAIPATIEEISPFLPDGHPDKIKDITSLEQEALKRYPKGTKFYPAHVGKQTVYTSTGKIKDSNEDSILMHTEETETWNPNVYWKGAWAEIEEESTKYVKCIKSIQSTAFIVGKVYTWPTPINEQGSKMLELPMGGNIWAFEYCTKAEYEAQEKRKPVPEYIKHEVQPESKFKVGDTVNTTNKGFEFCNPENPRAMMSMTSSTGNNRVINEVFFSRQHKNYWYGLNDFGNYYSECALVPIEKKEDTIIVGDYVVATGGPILEEYWGTVGKCTSSGTFSFGEDTQISSIGRGIRKATEDDIRKHINKLSGIKEKTEPSMIDEVNWEPEVGDWIKVINDGYHPREKGNLYQIVRTACHDTSLIEVEYPDNYKRLLYMRDGSHGSKECVRATDDEVLNRKGIPSGQVLMSSGVSGCVEWKGEPITSDFALEQIGRNLVWDSLGGGYEIPKPLEVSPKNNISNYVEKVASIKGDIKQKKKKIYF